MLRLIIAVLMILATSVVQAQELAAGKEIVLFNPLLKSFSANQDSAFRSTFPVMAGSERTKIVGLNSLPSAFQSTFSVNATPLQKVTAACSKIKAENPGVLCSGNFTLRAAALPNDYYFSALYGMAKIGAPAAWNRTTGSRAVKVAVIDTGIDLNHADLVDNLSRNTAEIASNGIDDDNNGVVDDVFGANFNSGTPLHPIARTGNPQDDHGHGTHCAGTIGATGNNSIGVSGVNWAVGLIAVKALDAEGSGSTNDIADAVYYAVQRGAQVISMSLGGGGASTAMFEAISYANSRGVLVVAAAGNEAANNDITASYPANYALPNIIAVASTDQDDSLSSFSNYGVSKVHLAAPGRSIISTYPGNGYQSSSGTSMATPHVAGAAALVKAANPSLSMLQVKDLLLNNVDVLSNLSGKIKSSGRLNVGKAVAAAFGDTGDQPVINPTPQPTTPPTTPPSSGPGSEDPDDGDDEDEDPADNDVPTLETSGKINAAKKRVEIKGDVFFSVSFEGISTMLTAKCSNAKNASVASRADGTFSINAKLKKSVSSTKCKVSAPEVGLNSRSFTVKAPRKRSTRK